MFKKSIRRKVKDNLKQKTWQEWMYGAAASFLGFVLFSPDHFTAFPWIKDLAVFAASGGLAYLGFGNVRVVRREK
jgi:hypothetical protein